MKHSPDWYTGFYASAWASMFRRKASEARRKAYALHCIGDHARCFHRAVQA